MNRDRDKFSFAQMTSNTDGKTSGSGTMGVVIVTTGLVAFLAGVLAYIFMDEGGTEIMTQSIVLITLGTGLLGYRKSRDGRIPTTSDAERPAVVEPPVVEEPVHPDAEEDMSGGDG